MLYTPLYYDKNNYERKEDEINGHTQHSRWCPVVALLTMSWWLLPLCHAAAPHIHPDGGCCYHHQPSLVPLSLSSPVHMSLPPYKQLLIVEGSGAMGIIISPLSLSSSCSALVVLVLMPLALALVLVLSSSSPPSPPPPCSASLWRW